MAQHLRCPPDARTVFRQQRGGCSDVQWAESVAAALPRAAPVTYVNVGANKGYRVPEFLSLWSQHPIDGHTEGWQSHVLRYADLHGFRFLKHYSCGNCGDCHGRRPTPHNRTGARMHLLELAHSNRALLRYLLDVEKLADRVTLHQLAASNVSTPLSVYKNIYAGDERGSVLMGSRAKRLANASDVVPAVALDDFFRDQQLHQAYHVAIDTEGWDALVVEGMRGVLQRRQVALVEFEVSNRGMWNRESPRARMRQRQVSACRTQFAAQPRASKACSYSVANNGPKLCPGCMLGVRCA